MNEDNPFDFGKMIHGKLKLFSSQEIGRSLRVSEPKPQIIIIKPDHSELSSHMAHLLHENMDIKVIDPTGRDEDGMYPYQRDSIDGLKHTGSFLFGEQQIMELRTLRLENTGHYVASYEPEVQTKKVKGFKQPTALGRLQQSKQAKGL